MRLVSSIVVLVCLLAVPARGADTAATWVFFADRGLTSRGAEAAAISEARASLSPRALARRATKGQAPDLLDVPPAPDYVAAVLATGATLRHESRWLNAISVEASPAQRAAIESLPFVTRTRPVARQHHDLSFDEVEIDEADGPPARGALDYGPSARQAEQIQVDLLHDLGLSGAGVTIAVLDTGFDTSFHEAFQNLTVVAEHDFVQGDGNTANEGNDPSNQFYHGTLVLSTLSGWAPGQLIGIAYGADYALAKTETLLSETPAEEDNWVAAAEWADSLGADVITSSLGYRDWYVPADMDGDTAPISIAADLAVANGIAVFVSGGNEGGNSWNIVTAPGDAHDAVTVGAVDSLGAIASFSGRGPTADGRTKPDVCAMGVATYHAAPWDPAGNVYARANGTSLSCPLVAGVGALLLEAEPTLAPLDLAAALRSTATQSGAPNNDYGWGIVQALDARESLATSAPAPNVAGPSIAVSPNPATGPQTLRLAAPRTRATTVEIVDVAGRRVREIAVPGGASSFSWDGRDASGELVSSGLYFARVDGIPAARLVRLR
ncbi:MAG: S8 family serine peptidase [Gemmatimonadetes bacterium]|nr:S8 family serine peptidase [Gemmatimonadota bacterium]